MLAHFSHHLLTALPVPLLPLIRDDFALDYTRSGFVLSALNIPYGISQLPGGWLADRVRRRVVITLSICGVALAGLLVGLSQSYIMMLIFLVLMGVLGGGYHPAASPAISALVPPENRGRALGFHMIGGSASYFMVPLLAAAIAAAWGWRGSFITLAIPTMVFGIVFYLLLGKQVGTEEAESEMNSSREETPSTPIYWHRLIPFIILIAFCDAVAYAVIPFIPLFIVDNFGVGKETAATFIAIIYFAGLWAAPLGGFLSDRLGMLPVTVVVCLITGPVIYLLNLAPYSWGIFAVLLIIGILLYIRAPASEAYIIGQVSERYRSTILGIYYFGSMEGSGILTPVIGYLADQFGFYFSFTIAGAAIVVVTLICAIFLRGSSD